MWVFKTSAQQKRVISISIVGWAYVLHVGDCIWIYCVNRISNSKLHEKSSEQKNICFSLIWIGIDSIQSHLNGMLQLWKLELHLKKVALPFHSSASSHLSIFWHALLPLPSLMWKTSQPSSMELLAKLMCRLDLCPRTEMTSQWHMYPRWHMKTFWWNEACSVIPSCFKAHYIINKYIMICQIKQYIESLNRLLLRTLFKHFVLFFH